VDKNVEILWIKMWIIRQDFSLHKLAIFARRPVCYPTCGKEKFWTQKKILESEKKLKNALVLSAKTKKSRFRDQPFSEVSRDFSEKLMIRDLTNLGFKHVFFKSWVSIKTWFDL